MDAVILNRLQKLNQLRLTEDETEDMLSFFRKAEKDLELLDTVDTDSIERMVHVMPIMTVVRDDKVYQNFSREDLQAGAPETDEGYWCVPKVVE